MDVSVQDKKDFFKNPNFDKLRKCKIPVVKVQYRCKWSPNTSTTQKQKRYFLTEDKSYLKQPKKIKGQEQEKTDKILQGIK